MILPLVLSLVLLALLLCKVVPFLEKRLYPLPCDREGLIGDEDK